MISSQLFEDVFLHLFQLAFLPFALVGLLGIGHDHIEIHVGPLKITVGLGGEEIAIPHRLGCVGESFGLQIDHLAAVFLHKGLGGQGGQTVIFLGGDVGEHVGQGCLVDALLAPDDLDAHGIDPYRDVLTLERYRQLFGHEKHPFTGVDYVEYYENLIRESGAEVEVIFANHPQAILQYTKNILCCDIHTRARTKRLLKAAGAERVLGLDELMNTPVQGSGYNEKYGLLGSNKSTEDQVKLFPRDCQELVQDIQRVILDRTGKHVEVMVYGDGAFKDPVGKIWELADPVVSPAYTAGLEGTPNELKLKYLADNDFAQLSGEVLKEAIKEAIHQKDENLVGQMVSEGTTPRRLTDLIGSLCDLTSGSGDKGTPIVYIQGYFDNYTTE